MINVRRLLGMPNQSQTISYEIKGQLNAGIELSSYVMSINALSVLINETHKELKKGKDDHIEIKIKGVIQGSIISQIIINNSFINTIMDSGVTVQQILEIIGLSAGLSQITGLNLIETVKFMKGKKLKEEKKLKEGYALTNQDGDVKMVSEPVYNLLQNANIKDCIINITMPMNDINAEGVETVIDGKVTPIFSKKDYKPLRNFSGISNDNTVVQPEVEDYVTIHTAAFESKNWKFFVNGAVQWIEIEDEDFLISVKNGQKFAKGDTLNVIMQTTINDENGAIKRSTKIKRVLKIINKPQAESVFESDPSTDE